MALSHEVISQFAKLVNNDKNQSSETTVYGTVVDQHGNKPGFDADGNEIIIDETGGKYIRPDGSDQLIPISDSEEDPAKPNTTANTTANTDYGDRVSVLIKDHNATVTGNISSPSTNNNEVNAKITETKIIIAEQIQAEKAYLQTLIADKASIGELKAAEAKLTNLEADKASVEELNATKAEIDDLKATKIDADIVEANYATIKSLEAADAKIGSLDTEIADINTLMFGSATGNVLQTTFANAVVALLGDAQIKSAMIESLNASKINAGSINTSNVKMESADGKLIISDNTIQISDNKRVRVQIGKDASNDYSISIWDVDGNLMFSEGGITDSAIKEAIIRNDMVSDDANIDAKKLDIDSLFTEINGSTKTIKSTKVYFDSQEQTLDVAFNEMNTTVTEQGELIESQGTDISVIQGQINSKIWQQDIDTATNEQNTKYSELEQNLDGFKTEVSEIYSTKDELENLEIGGRNLLKYTGDMPLTYDLTTGISSYGTAKPLTKTADGVRFDVPADGRGGISVPLVFDGAIQNGETVTISFDYRGTLTDTGSFYFLQRTSPNVSVNTFPDAIVSEVEWQRYSYTFSSNYANERSCYAALLFYMGNTEAGKWIEIKSNSLKLERGSKATDWSPAPEDMVSNAELNARETSLRSSISDVKQSAKEISLRVSSVETSVEDNEKNVKDQFESIRKDVEAKVSKDGFEVSVQQIISQTGASSVDTGTGYKFGVDGLVINKQDSDGNITGGTNTKIDYEGMEVRDNETSEDAKPILTANKNGVNAKNLEATTYLVVGGRSRFENYGADRTACFWIGGDING